MPCVPDPKQYPVQYGVKRQIWVENLDSVEERKLALLDLHPDIFGAYPRMDIIHANIVWQKNYSTVNYNHVKNVKVIYLFMVPVPPVPVPVPGTCLVKILKRDIC